MKFKIDENFPLGAKDLLLRSGHDCHTVYDEGIAGGPDEKLIEICLHEQRHLITLDLDFADIVAYPPEKYHGIVVFRLSRQFPAYVLKRFDGVLRIIESMDLDGHLVIVDDSRIRTR